MPDRDAPSPDALDAALDWLLSFYLPEFGTPEDRAAARAAVRKAAEQGEVFTVDRVTPMERVGKYEVVGTIWGTAMERGFGLMRPAVRVRVTRIEEAP